MIATYKKTVRTKPKGSELTIVWQIISTAIRKNNGRIWKIQNQEFWEPVKSWNLQGEHGVSPPWNDGLVEDVRRTISVCIMFLFWPVWIMNNGGVGTIASSQGSSMTTKGAPNDVLVNVNPLTIIVFTLFLSYVLYPSLNKFKIQFGRINRITLGFTLTIASGIVGAIIQWQVYETSPCGYHATSCNKGIGVSPLSIWIQWPIYALSAMSECL